MSDPESDKTVIGIKKLLVEGSLELYHLRGDQHFYLIKNATLTDTLTHKSIRLDELVVFGYYDLPSSFVYPIALKEYERYKNVVFTKLTRLKKKVKEKHELIGTEVDIRIDGQFYESPTLVLKAILNRTMARKRVLNVGFDTDRISKKQRI